MKANGRDLRRSINMNRIKSGGEYEYTKDWNPILFEIYPEFFFYYYLLE